MSAPAAAKKTFTSFYRLAGLGYLDSLEVASTALRKVLKEPFRSEALGRSNFKYREFAYDGEKEFPGGALPRPLPLRFGGGSSLLDSEKRALLSLAAARGLLT
jgi:hypothetical protein